ncbi:PAS domain-containing protein [Spongiivirga citrea]|uniref:PAS domain-containing protein n=1 Tax=Spongiivirga citrea TaxID=1481457 RepID=A0A6M0CFR4_9FLAO|nr:PAS domain-containing protein [Spongiivirga citrea]NER15703.1 PAS domain-containing protein [Spongiivirga citrea]
MIDEKISLEKIVEKIPGVVFQFEICNSGITRFPFVSKGFDDIFEVPADNFKENASLALSRIHPEDYQALMYNVFDCYKSGKTFTHTFRVVSSTTKKTIWLKISAIPESYNPNCGIWFGYMSDLTNEIEKYNFS